MIQLIADWKPLWPWVKTGLERIIARTHPTWIPEDVYTELKTGQSSLATIDDDAGFLILKRLQDYDGTVLFVWCLYGEGLAARQEPLEDELRKMARTAGCRRVQMRSPRRGWERAGWRERETVYEQEA